MRSKIDALPDGDQHHRDLVSQLLDVLVLQGLVRQRGRERPVGGRLAACQGDGLVGLDLLLGQDLLLGLDLLLRDLLGLDSRPREARVVRVSQSVRPSPA
ncbi:MAG: hypothetical protein HY262_06545 [Chloroflexi bacterium]|nr:hypothetical protein [Chloroflexota bacterium]